MGAAGLLSTSYTGYRSSLQLHEIGAEHTFGVTDEFNCFVTPLMFLSQRAEGAPFITLGIAWEGVASEHE